jgi:murein DD-endopeptidase MepM/ murein hydrolase activator NlpD
MKFGPPYEGFNIKTDILQLYGMAAAYYYKNFPNLNGHDGWDLRPRGAPNLGYGTPILAVHDGTISSIQEFDARGRRSNGIYLKSTDGSFFTVYWHLSRFNDIRLFQPIKAGEVIGFMGNSGFVDPPPTPQNPYSATHLHLAVYIPGANPANSDMCDPAPYMVSLGDRLPFYLGRNLAIGSTGDDVSFLQTLLKLELPEVQFQPVSYYGNQTRLAVQKLQTKYGLTPFPGFVGPQTKLLLNKRYSQFYS